MTQPVSETAQLKIVRLIAQELGVGPQQVAAAVALLDEGATVPFIARYRKEATGNLDDTHLRTLEERLLYLRELEERRAAILASIEEQGKLTAELRSAVEAATTKQALEDIYLPYKPRRRTKAQIAREAGLEPLAEALEAVVPHPCVAMIAAHFGIEDRNRPADPWLAEVCRWTWRVKASLHISTELLVQLREAAETEAIRIFGRNLHELLLAAPAGPKAVLGLDPGIRTGCKVAVVDATGKLLATATIYPHQPRNDWQGSLATLARMAVQHGVELIAIGNGTASRETDKLAAELIKLVNSKKPEQKLTKIVVSEAGASVYSASAFAAAEFPELDVSLRGAVSIARRLQDPLAELVKIDPKAIGVGQYQHDVNQRALARSLDATVEDCVNAVGVDVNTASAPLLARVSGLNGVLAKNIVEYRDAHGPFPNRRTIRKVPRLGDKTFEQAAGFLRINNSDNPLDRSSVHPEAYPVVERILARIGKGIVEVMGQPAALQGLSAAEFTDDKFGVLTVCDILAELEKPGRDPRPEFKTATFQDGVESLNDLRPDMILEGVVTNVAAFGAFVDIGVHQDGLVHVSALANKFVKDPHDVVKPGQIVKVKVLEVDVKRQRIALTLRLDDVPGTSSRSGGARGSENSGANTGAARGPRDRRPTEPKRAAAREPQPGGAMELAFAKLKK